MGWRKTLVEAAVAKVQTLGYWRTVEVWNKEIEEGIKGGRIPVAPFVIVGYSGFSSEALGEKARREIGLPLVVGLKGTRGEQAAFRGTGAAAGEKTFDDVLEDLEDLFWGTVLVAGTSPVIVGSEEYLGGVGGVEMWGVELVITAVMTN